MKRYFILCFGVLFSLTNYAQNSSITATVIDNNKNPITAVNIQLFKAQDVNISIRGTTSNNLGKFTLNNLPSGNYILEFSHINYEFYSKQVSIIKNKQKDLRFIILQEQLQKLDEIIISGKKIAVTQTADRITVNVAQNIVGSGGTAVDVLKQLSTVKITSDGVVSIKGKSDIQILIDGKPSGFAALQGQRFLSQLDLSTIDKIVVISNPSAIKSGSGAGGIINVIRKKNIKSGFNGSINIGFGSDEWYHFSPQISYRTGAFNLFSNYTYRRRKRLNSNGTFKEQQQDGSVQIIDENQSGKRIDKRNNFEFGLDYYLTETKYFTISGNYRNRDKTNLQGRQTIVSESNVTTESRTGDISEPETNEGWGATAQYKSTVENEKKLNVLLDYVHSVEDEDIFREEIVSSGGSDFLDGIQSFYIDINDQYLMDIENEISLNENTKFIFGAQAVFRKISQTFNVSEFNNSINTYENIPDSDDEFNYEDFITSIYSQIGIDQNKWSYEAAIRLELLNNKYNSESNNKVFRDSYFKFFPSLKLTHDFTNITNMVFSFKKGINRPSPNRLNPFPSVSNAFNVSVGNPELDPEVFYNIETGLSSKIKEVSITAGLFFTLYKDLIQQITELRDANITFRVPININNAYHYGADFSLQKNITKWWNQQLGGVLYNRIYKDDIIEGTEQIAFSVKSTTRLSFTKQLETQIFGSYNAPENIPQGTMESLFYIDIGIEYKFLKNKAKLSITGTDIFNTLEEVLTLLNDGLISRIDQKINTQRVYITFNYKF